MRVVFAASARDDLDSIADWIGADDLDHALTFTSELRAKCQALASRPRIYPVVRRLGDVDLRRCNHRGYAIIYSVDESVVRVLQVLHGARDIGSLLPPG